MDEEIAAYRRQIVRLTQERDEARRERDEARAKLKTDLEILRAQIREGTSARVEALRRTVADLTTRNDRQARDLKAALLAGERPAFDALIEMSRAEPQ